jgi:hypothetical protein
VVPAPLLGTTRAREPGARLVWSLPIRDERLQEPTLWASGWVRHRRSKDFARRGAEALRQGGRCLSTPADCNDSVAAHHFGSCKLYGTAPTRIVAAVIQRPADSGTSRLAGAYVPGHCADSPTGHHHAAVTFYVCAKSHMVAAVTPAVTASRSDGLCIVLTKILQ